MNIRDEIDAINSGKPKIRKKCPVCGGYLKVIIFGYPTSETADTVQRHNDYFTLGGCICFDDDRDPDYICPRCGGSFTEDLEQIILIPCPLEAGHQIHKNECKNYELLESKTHYSLLENRDFICNKICPLLGKRVQVITADGSIYEGNLEGTYEYTVSKPGNHIMLSNPVGEYQCEYTDIYISDISALEIA